MGTTDPWIEGRVWARPEAIAAGRLPMTALRRRGDDVVSLDGDWDLTLLDRPGGTERARATVEVPGCWTMQGLGDIPRYTNVQMPFAGTPPEVPDDNPTGVYRRRVEVPEAWAGDRIVLRVGGAETVLIVEVDGVPVGFGTDSRLPQDFDLTPLVTAGDGFDLTLTVVRWGAATYLEDQDHWHHAGLHRSVDLLRMPATHLADVTVVADRDPATGEGTLAVEVHTGGPAVDGARIRVLLDGSTVGEADAAWPAEDYVTAAYLQDGVAARVHASVWEVEAWTAETPHLHDVTIELVDAGGTPIDATMVRTGFRRVQVVGDQLLINGRAVLIRGVNRHDHDPRRGKAVTADSIRRDLELMKAHNLNAVRTSHYPSDPVLYDLCDELGLYVVDEANLETHAHLRSLTKDPVWAPAILERITRMARRDRNHPSIILWSLGNESGASPILDAAATWLRRTDPTRPVQYESAHFDLALSQGLTGPQAWEHALPSTDVLAPMYPTIEDLHEWATERDHVAPLIMCEFEHAMNNSCGDLDRYWDLVRSHRGLQGGFLWDWVDQALVQTLPDGTERLAYGGDFGDVPNDGTFCLNGLVDAHRNPHPSLLEVKTVFQPVRFEDLGGGRVRITNDHEVLDLTAVGPVDWAVTVDGDEIAAGTEALALPAGASTILRLDLPVLDLTGWQIAHLTLRVGEVAQWQVELGRSQERAPVDGDGLTTPYLPTRLALWRAPIDNETYGPAHAARWEREGLATAHERIDLHTDVDGDLVTHEVTVPAEHDDPARIGVRLDLPAGVTTVEWIGAGPHENTTDRQASAIVGQWRTAVDDWAVPYVHPQASGNRTGVRSLRFLDAAGVEVCRIEELEDLQVTVSRWTDEEIAAAGHLEDLPTRDHAFVWLDVAHRGVGSGACGPDTSLAHRPTAGRYRWSYRLR